jgi:ribose 5-phosphate isomerase B
MKLALATDHAGFENLAELKTYLESIGYECMDFGPASFTPDDDYPEFMFAAAKAVASGECSMGIILGGSGTGEAMAANRIKGARCALYYGPSKPVEPVDTEGNESDDPYEILKLSRQHNNANVLSLGARFLTFEQIKQAVDIWLNTDFSGIERHARRIKQLDD